MILTDIVEEAEAALSGPHIDRTDGHIVGLLDRMIREIKRSREEIERLTRQREQDWDKWGKEIKVFEEGLKAKDGEIERLKKEIEWLTSTENQKIEKLKAALLENFAEDHLHSSPDACDEPKDVTDICGNICTIETCQRRNYIFGIALEELQKRYPDIFTEEKGAEAR